MSKIDQVMIEREVPCIVRDGVTLYANIYRPKDAGSYPVLLTRLPYNKNLPDFSHRYVDPIRLALAGYVVIIQDVRGRFASEGEFSPFIQEFEDGYDTVEWAAKLPYANGKVGMFGLSYYGFTQLYAALERPPSLKAIFPAMTGNLSGGGLFERDGVTELAAVQTWVLDSIANDYLDRNGNLSIKEIANDLDRIDEWHKYTPFQAWPPIWKHPQLISFYKQYFSDHFDRKLQREVHERIEKNGQLDMPAYHLAGWYDSHLAPTLLNYEQMQNERNHQKLIVGPWSHGFFGSDIGERSFGFFSAGHAIDGEDDLTSLHIDWFHHWLKEDNESPIDDKPVKLFVMGINQWRAEQEWPLKRTEYIPYYLASDGASGQLLLHPPSKMGSDQYLYDPYHPVPSCGGGTLFYKGRNSGPRDQREIEKREDVVVYTSAPMTAPLEVTGWITVELWVATDAVSTDFTAKLIDVFPDGRAYNLTDGITRINMKQDDKVIRCEINVWATSNVFLPGHSIRLEISSSNFPRFDVNPNTGQSLKDTIERVSAQQVIYHGAAYPSHIRLPIIPSKA